MPSVEPRFTPVQFSFSRCSTSMKPCVMSTALPSCLDLVSQRQSCLTSIDESSHLSPSINDAEGVITDRRCQLVSRNSKQCSHSTDHHEFPCPCTVAEGMQSNAMSHRISRYSDNCEVYDSDIETGDDAHDEETDQAISGTLFPGHLRHRSLSHAINFWVGSESESSEDETCPMESSTVPVRINDDIMKLPVGLSVASTCHEAGDMTLSPRIVHCENLGMSVQVSTVDNATIYDESVSQCRLPLVPAKNVKFSTLEADAGSGFPTSSKTNKSSNGHRFQMESSEHLKDQTLILALKQKPPSILKQFFTSFFSLSPSSSDDEIME